MSITKQRNKQVKSEWLKAYWKVYDEWMEIRSTLDLEGEPGEFSKRMIRAEAKKLLKGNK